MYYCQGGKVHPKIHIKSLMHQDVSVYAQSVNAQNYALRIRPKTRGSRPRPVPGKPASGSGVDQKPFRPPAGAWEHGHEQLTQKPSRVAAAGLLVRLNGIVNGFSGSSCFASELIAPDMLGRARIFGTKSFCREPPRPPASSAAPSPSQCRIITKCGGIQMWWSKRSGHFN